MNTLLKSSVIICALASAYASSSFADVTDTIERSFSVGDNSQFSLENINGDVIINSWNESSIKVEAIINADSQEDRELVEVKMKQNGQHVDVSTHYDEHSNKRHNQTAKVEYNIWLPSDTTLSDVELVNGSLQINNVSGEVNAQVVNGSIKATGLTTDSDISSVNGSIKVSYQSFAQDIEDIELETVNGSIKLYLPNDINAALDIETMHGSIKTDFGLRAEENSFVGKHLKGNIGSGDVEVNLESVNGSVKVLKK